MYAPEHYRLEEWFSKKFFDRWHKRYGDGLWRLIDDRILYTYDRIRVRYGRPVRMNTWVWGGNFNLRGFRDPASGVGANFSQHKFGRAGDSDVEGMEAEEVRQDILANPYDEDFAFITAIELEVNWLHIDCRNWNKQENGIFQFKRG